VDEARWDDTNNKWRTRIKRIGGKEAEIGESYTINSDFLVSAVGQLNEPHYPEVPGLDIFNGKIMHSARWDWDYSLRGKRVGIIGTGATAAQIIPEITPQCSQLVVFQRTPAWVMPRHDHAISPTRQAIYKYVPFVRKRYRASLMDVRESIFDAAFDPSSAKHSLVTNVSHNHMHTQLTGDCCTSLSEKLTPKYPFSCKRIIVSDDYYPALTKPNVFLETTAISQVTPTGITMADGTHHELDCIILATGFRTTKFLYPIRIYGSGGHSLSEAWENGASAYLGITVPSLPNFAMLYGPNTNLAYNSLILQIEAQSLYIKTLISAVLDSKRKGKTLRLEPKVEVVDRYNSEVQERLGKSTYADPSCTSWFKDEHGRITTNWCGSAIYYQERVNFVDWSDYDILGTAAVEVERKGKTRWRRRVEETQVSDRVLGVGAAGVFLFGMAVAGWWGWGLRW
jgi:cation diffusion facilitator CzcD-associated flavoprotein CzcO